MAGYTAPRFVLRFPQKVIDVITGCDGRGINQMYQMQNQKESGSSGYAQPPRKESVSLVFQQVVLGSMVETLMDQVKEITSKSTKPCDISFCSSPPSSPTHPPVLPRKSTNQPAYRNSSRYRVEKKFLTHSETFYRHFPSFP